MYGTELKPSLRLNCKASLMYKNSQIVPHPNLKKFYGRGQ